MSVYDRPSLLKKILFAAWGMVTLVLVFCVMLLVNELVRQGHDPFELPDEKAPRPASVAPVMEATESRDVTLYFASADGARLQGEKRLVAYGESTVENCRAVLEALIRGSNQNLPRILPPSAQIRALYLLKGGELVIDFHDELQMAESTGALSEALMAYGVANSVTRPELRGTDGQSVRSVLFLVGGAAPTGHFPSHIDVSRPLEPNMDWVEETSGRMAANG